MSASEEVQPPWERRGPASNLNRLMKVEDPTAAAAVSAVAATELGSAWAEPPTTWPTMAALRQAKEEKDNAQSRQRMKREQSPQATEKPAEQESKRRMKRQDSSPTTKARDDSSAEDSSPPDMNAALAENNGDVITFMRKAAVTCTKQAAKAARAAEKTAEKAVRKAKLARHLTMVADTYEQVNSGAASSK